MLNYILINLISGVMCGDPYCSLSLSPSSQVVSSQWDGVLGSCDITVTSDPIAPSDLSVQVVSGLDMSITGSPAHPWVVTTTVTAFNVLRSPDQVSQLSVGPPGCPGEHPEGLL